MAFNKNKVMDSARKYVAKGQVDRAIKEYLRVVKEDPKDVRVWLKVGDLYAKRGAKQEAIETYLKVAKFYSEQGFYLKAVAVYKQILKLDARMLEVNLKLAELYRQLGLLSDAMQHFEMVAGHFHREGKTKEALATVRQLVDLDPDNIATRIKLAELYSKEDMKEEAVAEFSHACEQLRSHNRQDDFIKVAERLLWHKPDRHELNRELATLYLRRNDPRRALQKLQACFKADSRDVETLALLAQAFQALDQKAKTVSVLKELARVLDEDGQKAQAKEVHRKILGFVPDDADALAYLGERAPAAKVAAVAAAPVAAVAPAPSRPPPMAPPRSTAVGSHAEQRPSQRFAFTQGDVPQRRMNPTGSVPIVNDVPEEELYGGRSITAAEDDFAADLSLDEEAGYETGSVSAELHADEIVKILTETDVYVKYGLHKKAIDHLNKVFELDPDNAEAREQLKDIYLSQGRESDAIGELMQLAELYATTDPDRAEQYLRDILGLDGSYTPAFDLAERFRLEIAGGPNVEIIDDFSDAIEVDESDVGAGHVAPVDDEMSFDDLSFEDDFAADDVVLDDMPSGDAFEFELDDLGDADDSLALPEENSGVTMEVSVDQVEDMVALDDDSAELEFDHSLIADEEPVAEFDYRDAKAFDAGLPHRPESPIPSADPGYAAAPGYGSEADDLGFDQPHFADAVAAPTYSADDLSSETVDVPYEAVIGDAAFDPAPTDILDVDPDSLDAAPLADVSGLEAEFETIEPQPVPEVLSDFSTGELMGQTVDEPLPFDQSYEEPLAEPPQNNISLEDDLDEADFFVAQGLYSEARDILNGLLERYPNHPLVAAKLQDVDAMDAAGGGDAEPAAPEFAVDELGLDALEELEVGPEIADHTIDVSEPAVMLENPIEDEDADTHYDLGLAYKEMGLYGEAIKAFEKVMTVKKREVQCYLMIGLCHQEQGGLSEAIHHFKAGLHSNNITDSEKLNLYYEIASCYERLNDASEAVYFYEMVNKKDATYRDTASRLAQLKTSAGGIGTDTRRTAVAPDDADLALDSLLAEGDLK